MLLTIFHTASAQECLSAPAIGWDSLRTMFVYPEIARRAGFQATMQVSVEFDTAGNVLYVGVTGFEIFEAPVRDVVQNIRWIHSTKGKDGRYAPVNFFVEYKLNDRDRPSCKTLTVSGESPVAGASAH